MLEVAVGAVVAHIDVFAKVVEVTPDLFEGLPWSENDLRRMHGRVDWDPYAVLLDRLGERCGRDEVVEAVGARMDETGLWLAFLLQTVVSPLHLLEFWERMVPKLWRSMTVRHLDRGDGTVELTTELRHGYRGCRTMFVASGPAIATSTRRIGLPPMEVLSSNVSDRQGTYVYRLPPSKTIPTRLRKEWEALLEFLSMDDQALPPLDRQPATIAGRSIRSEFARDAWGLTVGEMRVLELLVKGHTNKEIADGIGIVEGTVEAHVGAILKKAGATNRTMLVYRYWTLETDGFQ